MLAEVSPQDGLGGSGMPALPLNGSFQGLSRQMRVDMSPVNWEVCYRADFLLESGPQAQGVGITRRTVCFADV